MTKFPVLPSNQYAPFAMWPAGRIALRSLSEIPMTRDWFPFAIFNSSPSVLTSSFRGEAPVPAPPKRLVAASDTLVTTLPVSRSNQSLPTIPLIEGVAPVSSVL